MHWFGSRAPDKSPNRQESRRESDQSWRSSMYPLQIYDREGQPITIEQWAVLIGDLNYIKVAENTLPDGMWISTVWLGINHRFLHKGPPLIFETGVFRSKDNLESMDQRRYSTEADAIVGHF